MSGAKEVKNFWFQEAALDLLQRDMAPGKRFGLALVTYRALCAIASDTDSEPGPDRDGKPFKAKLVRVGQMVSRPWEQVANLLPDLIRLGLIDPVTLPEDPLEMFIMRLCLLDDPKSDDAAPEGGTQ
jgi:hypothetical protein